MIWIKQAYVLSQARSATAGNISSGLLARGFKVRSITGHCERAKNFPQQVEVCPYNFEAPRRLEKIFEGADVFYNTYWVRFPHGDLNFEKAVKNSKILIAAAKKAGVPRMVNISITNAGTNSHFEYFRGKALVDQAVMDSGMSYAISRPTVIFGVEDILVNNIAWLLRKFPVFAIPGDGAYQVQPIFVEDLAEIAIAAGFREDNQMIDAVGPEIFSFEQMVVELARRVSRRTLIVHLRPEIFIMLTRFLNPLVKDIILTRDEVYGLMANLLVSKQKPTGKTKFTSWLEPNKDNIGRKYASELQRHYLE